MFGGYDYTAFNTNIPLLAVVIDTSLSHDTFSSSSSSSSSCSLFTPSDALSSSSSLLIEAHSNSALPTPLERDEMEYRQEERPRVRAEEHLSSHDFADPSFSSSLVSDSSSSSSSSSSFSSHPLTQEQDNQQQHHQRQKRMDNTTPTTVEPVVVADYSGASFDGVDLYTSSAFTGSSSINLDVRSTFIVAVGYNIGTHVALSLSNKRADAASEVIALVSIGIMMAGLGQLIPWLQKKGKFRHRRLSLVILQMILAIMVKAMTWFFGQGAVLFLNAAWSTKDWDAVAIIQPVFFICLLLLLLVIFTDVPERTLVATIPRPTDSTHTPFTDAELYLLKRMLHNQLQKERQKQS